jgi:formylglycine-generating enzyme required for sulfatase activity
MRIERVIKYFFSITGAIVISAFGIDAADHFGDLSQSIFGRVISGKAQLCPDDMVFVKGPVGGFCIDKYENSASDNCDLMNPQSDAETKINIDQTGCLPVSMVGNVPWTNVTQNQAVMLCAKAGKRLPTSQEWYFAALGTPDKNQNWDADDCQVDSNWDNQPGPTGTGASCVAYSGAHDMIGNVWEWTIETMQDGKLNGKFAPEQGYILSVDEAGIAGKTGEQAEKNYNFDYFWVKKQGQRGVARGGYWDNKEKAGQYTVYLASAPSFSGLAVGFRCVK